MPSEAARAHFGTAMHRDRLHSQAHTQYRDARLLYDLHQVWHILCVQGVNVSRELMLTINGLLLRNPHVLDQAIVSRSQSPYL